ncbi:zinc ribbon domain-containing protein [Fusibacter sp. JL216-2]|uniref:zinc ribbon domain-containing protein n=1 Tax=Fusibacter sp. JL216-2 TaxID=3071453 RepID=UPI003D32AB96
MFLIMGIQDKTKTKRISSPLPCHICDGDKGFEVNDRFSYFHLFFLPIWTWGHRFTLKCSKCDTHYNLKEQSKLNLKDIGSGLSYWDIEPVSIPNAYTMNTCKKCGYHLEDDFDYCPKCGMSLEK